MAILLMVTFTFIGAAAAYRAGGHIAVGMLTDRLPRAAAGCAGPLAGRLADGAGLPVRDGLGHQAVHGDHGPVAAELPWMPVGLHLPAAAAGQR
jgi:hypothetical protein